MSVSESATLAPMTRLRWRLTRIERKALLLALGMALVWWLVALWVRGTETVPVWYDQEHIFLRSAQVFFDPYQVGNFFNPPWAVIALLPFSLLPLPVAVLAQLALLFTALALVMLRFGGSFRSVAIALTSFLAFDNGLELNIEWLVCLGLLVPVAWSGPLLLVKPQSALGYYAGFRPRDWLKAAVVSLACLLLSFLVWGWWPPRMFAVQGFSTAMTFNVAPAGLLPAPVSIALSLALLWWAFRRRDPLLGILAWLFFVPYLRFYSLLLPFALACARWPRVALLISGVMWLVYGSVIARALLGF